jgi:tripartite-type tricarboxylate transporter receptor subunit TctC
MKRALAAIVLLLIAPVVWAQAYPSKPVRLISAYPPGGGGDAVARVIAQALTDQLGQQVIVDTRAGASGVIGTSVGAKSPPDGYTLLLGSVAPLGILPGSTKLPYDPRKDFQPLSLVALSDYVLTVHPSLPAKTISELISLGRSNPGKLTYASSGSMGGPHLAGELLSLRAKISLLHVPYKGTGAAAIGVMTGETTMMFGSGPSVVPHIAARKLRGVATTGLKRSITELPAIAEILPGYEVRQWYGILLPAGTPKEIGERLHHEIVRAVANPKVAQLLVNIGTQPETSTPEEFRVYIQSEIEKWTKVIRTANIRPD